MSTILGGGGNVTKVRIIDEIDKFVLKQREKYRTGGRHKNFGRGTATPTPSKENIKNLYTEKIFGGGLKSRYLLSPSYIPSAYAFLGWKTELFRQNKVE